MKHVGPSIWKERDLVVFDLDGTLYDQTRLRARVAVSLLLDAVRTGNLKTLKVLKAFRACREALAHDPSHDFVERQFADTADRCQCSKEYVENIVSEWFDRRPLAFLAACRYRGVENLFQGLRQSGRFIAVLSDYPAAEKLDALALKADLVVSATDPDVLRLKPDPAGLAKILRTAGISADRSLMVGDRFDRDWAVADRFGMDALIRSDRPDPRCATFRTYGDPLFTPVRENHGDAGWPREKLDEV